MVICGEDDESILVFEMAYEIFKRMILNGKSELCFVLSYFGIGYFIEFFFVFFCDVFYYKYVKIMFVWGGNVKDYLLV